MRSYGLKQRLKPGPNPHHKSLKLPRMRYLLASALLLYLIAMPMANAGQQKTLRYAFRVAETGFDPAQVSDIYSRTVTAHIFEAPYAFDPLARPAKLVPLVAAEQPWVSADYKRSRSS